MKSKLTLLALLSAGVMQLHGQGQGTGGNPQPAPNPIPSENETAWRKLVAEKKQPEESANKAYLDAGAAPEAQALKAAIMASANVSKGDYIILARIRNATNDAADFEASVRALAASNKTGHGVSMAKAQIKFWESDETGWTSDMILHQSKLSSKLAFRSSSPEFRNQVWNVIKDKNVVGVAREARVFFKQYRRSLPKAEQIEATRKQKEAILATPDRGAALNAWLVELSADIIALELDQP
jgi:hypothetical protein